jgi:hypothetical protein
MQEGAFDSPFPLSLPEFQLGDYAFFKEASF